MSEIRSQATPARDELAAYLDRVIDNEAWANTGDEAAKHIQHRLGWVKPRTVDGVEELDALPDLSVVRDAGHEDSPGEIWEKWYRPTGPQWMRVGSTKFRASDQITLPATVLFTPGEAG